MEIYLVETNADNFLCAVEDGKAIIVDGPNVNINRTDDEGTYLYDEIVAELTQIYSEEPMNDFNDIGPDDRYFDWNPEDYEPTPEVPDNRITRVF